MINDYSAIPLMVNVFVDATEVKVLSVLLVSSYWLHFESLLKHLLSSTKEYSAFLTLAEIQRLRQDSKELWLLETHADPFINKEFV